MQSDVTTTISNYVATVEIHRPPHNYFDAAPIGAIADAFELLDANELCRCIVLAAEGKSFCAGADFSRPADPEQLPKMPAKHLYKEAVRLFRTRKPIVAAVHGAAIGGGLGLAMVADFRVTCEEAKFSANFSRLGIHPGFGVSATLPKLVGPQRAAHMLYSGERLGGAAAVEIGLADRLVKMADVRLAATRMAEDIAQSAPLAVMSIRETLRRGLADAVEAATERELVEQEWQFKTADFREGTAAIAARRLPKFQGA